MNTFPYSHTPLSCNALEKPTSIPRMTTSRAGGTLDVRSYAELMTHLSITKYEKKALYHGYGLHSFIRNLIKKDKIHTFKTFVNDNSLLPKYWDSEKEYEVFHVDAEIVDIEEFIVVLIMSFKNIFDRDGKWGLKKQHNFFNLFANFQKMWSSLPYIYRDCVRPEWMDTHGNLVTPEWLLYWYYFVNFQGSENISIVNLVRIQNRSEYMAHLHECCHLEKNGGMGETRLVYQPVLRTYEANNVFYLDMEGAVYAHLVYRSLKHGVNVTEWDVFELNTRSTVQVEIYFLANPKSDYKEIKLEFEENEGMKFDTSAIRILPAVKPVTLRIYEMSLELNKFDDLERTRPKSMTKYFEIIEVRDLDFFLKEEQIMQKKQAEMQKLELEKLAMEEGEIFVENHKTVEDVGGYFEFDSEMNFMDEIQGIWEVMKNAEEKEEREER